MPTSDERREVAEELRYLADFPGQPIRYAVQLRDELFDVVLGLDERWDYSGLLSRLADLADPTCEMEDIGDVPESVKRNLSTWSCSECGSPIYNDMTPTYCTYCGFRVTGGERR